jgi:hypothetical protein
MTAMGQVRPAKQACFLMLLGTLAALLSGCAVLYLPDTTVTEQTSDIVSPFSHILYGYNDSYWVSFEDPDSSKLKHLHFLSGTITDEVGIVTQLRLRREMLENPNSFSMVFYHTYPGHDLRFRITVRSDGKPLVITFHARFKSKMHWPTDSDYSG